MVRRLVTVLFSLVALSPLVLVLWGGGRWGGAEETEAAGEGAPASSGGELRSEDGFALRLAEPPRRIACATAAAADLVTQLVPPERVALLPRAAFSFSRLADDPGPWGELPRFEGYGAETFLAHGVDLVIAATWQDAATTALLRGAGMPVLVLAIPESWDEVLEDLRLVARALGAEERGAALERSLAARVRALGERRRPLHALSYTNLGTGGWAAGRGTTADVVLRLAGLENAARRAGLVGHRELDLEGLLALAPEVLVIGEENAAEGIASTAAYLRSQPVLSELPALRDGLVIGMPQELFTTASTELVTAAERLADALDARLGPTQDAPAADR